MAARSQLRFAVRDQFGRAVTNARIDIYQPGTTTAFLGNAYASRTGTTPVTNPFLTDAQGEIEVWFERSQVVDVRVSDNSGTAYVNGDTSQTVSFPIFTEAVTVGISEVGSIGVRTSALDPATSAIEVESAGAVLRSRASGDAEPRVLLTNSSLGFGDGTAAPDVLLERSASGLLAVTGNSLTNSKVRIGNVGPGSVAAVQFEEVSANPAILYQSAADVLTTDDIIEFKQQDSTPSAPASGFNRLYSISEGGLNSIYVAGPSGVNRLHMETSGFIRKAADTSRSSTITLTDDPDLITPTNALPASSVWLVTAVLIYTGATTGDISVTLALTGTGHTGFFIGRQYFDAADAMTVDSGAIALGTGLVCGAATSARSVQLQAQITVGSSSTTLSVRWAQGTSTASATTLKAGSWLKWERIA